RLVQSAASTFSARLSLAHDVRAVARDQRSHSALRIDDRQRGCYLGTPLGEGAVTISKAVHRPLNRGKSNLSPLRERATQMHGPCVRKIGRTSGVARLAMVLAKKARRFITG